MAVAATPKAQLDGFATAPRSASRKQGLPRHGAAALLGAEHHAVKPDEA
jgi:hypothetical protein